MEQSEINKKITIAYNKMFEELDLYEKSMFIDNYSHQPHLLFCLDLKMFRLMTGKVESFYHMINTNVINQNMIIDWDIAELKNWIKKQIFRSIERNNRPLCWFFCLPTVHQNTHLLLNNFINHKKG